MTTATREYTHPDVLGPGIEQGWAEAQTDPTRIDWPPRQKTAAIPFKVVNGRPVNPCETTAVTRGRNRLGKWGENLMADACVTMTDLGTRFLLMVRRADGLGWAAPGGAVEPGETGEQAALRELHEETGLDLRLICDGNPQAPRYVPDPRASKEAWAVTVPVVFALGNANGLPPWLSAGDDAAGAWWVPADTYARLEGIVRRQHGGKIFPAHVDMLRDFLG